MAAVMTGEPAKVQRTYLTLMLFTTLSASLIWGINTLFLLDAGLNNLEAFAANAFFTAGMMVFEVPTGVVADLRGRRLSFLLGSATLTLSTLAYVLMWQLEAPFWAWAVVSVVIGLGLHVLLGRGRGVAGRCAALHRVRRPARPGVRARGRRSTGVAMLSGSVLGGIIAQFSSLGVPFVVRSVLLGVTFVLALLLMHDLGFTPVRGERPGPEMKRILNDSLHYGLGRPAVRWVMLTSPFIGGVGIYAFYAMQPYLLELYGDEGAYGIAGLAAAIVAGAQIAGGLSAPRLRLLFRRRTSLMLVCAVISVVALLLVSLVASFWFVIAFLVIWSLAFSVTAPVRQAYLNDLIPSQQRATVLSFDSLLGSAGGVVVQPAFGRVADVSGYALTFGLSAAVQACAIPFLALARRTGVAADIVTDGVAAPVQEDRA